MLDKNPLVEELGGVLHDRLAKMTFGPADHNDVGIKHACHEYIPFFVVAENEEELEAMVKVISDFAHEATMKMEVLAGELVANLQVIDKDAAERMRTHAADFARELLTPTDRYKAFISEESSKRETPPEGTWLTLGVGFAIVRNIFVYTVCTELWGPGKEDEDMWSLGQIQRFDSTLDRIS
jgi:hypothetical protein